MPTYAEEPMTYVSIGGGIIALDDTPQSTINLGIVWLYGFDQVWIGPKIDFLASEDGGIYFGINALSRIFIFDSMFLSLSTGAGWHQEGDIFNLRNTLNFKQEIGIGYQFTNGTTLSLKASHLSNAGLNDQNPGSEAAMIKVSRPLNLFQ